MSEMLDAGLTPNVVTYTSLMVVLRRAGQPEKSIKILDLMQSKVMDGCEPDTYISESLGTSTALF